MLAIVNKYGDTLSKQLSGELHTDDSILEEYSVGMCLYKVRPLGVVYPRNIEDIQHTVKFCARYNIPVIPRGGATGLVGQAIGMGIIIDLSKYMNSILSYSDGILEVEAGATIESMNNWLAPYNSVYPIDPQSAKWCTIGGNIGTNAAGARGIRYGATKDQIEEMTIVLSNGDILTFNHTGVIQGTAHGFSLIEATASLIRNNTPLILSKKPKTKKYSSGYNIFDSVDSMFDPVRFFCGSEGTLGIVSKVKVRTIPRVSETVNIILYCSSYADMADATSAALRFNPVAIEILDKSYSEYGKGMSETIDWLIEETFQAMLLVELDGSDKELLISAAHALVSDLTGKKLITASKILTETNDKKAAWTLREDVSMKLNKLNTERKKASIIEDGAVPIEKLPEYLSGLHAILQKYDITYTLYGHAGTGNIHCSTFVDFDTDRGRGNIEAATVEVFDLIIRLDGVLSGEHGDGFIRTPFQKRAFGEEVYAIFQTIKTLFDPHNLMNPGKVVGKQDGNFLHDVRHY